METNEGGARRRAWSAYWSSGRLHSCAGSYTGNYDGAIGRFWRGVAARMPAGARVLDLATGNGALPLLMWEERRGDLLIEAVDLATVAPDWYRPESHPGIRFHAGVAMEALPFADGCFELLASQFGFEYADRSRALAEALRVAAPGAVFALVLHHAGSVLVAVGREELSHHRRLAAEDGLLAAARAVIPWIARIRAGSAGSGDAAVSAREGYNRAMQALGAAAETSSAPDLLYASRDAIHGLVAGVAPDGAQSTLAALEAYAEGLEAARLRTAEMVASALDRAQLDELARMLGQARPGLVVECAELRQDEGVLAWSLLASPVSSPAG